MAYLEELLPEFRKGAKIRKNHWEKDRYLFFKDKSITNQMDFLVSFTGLDFEDDWEIYQDPIDWDYIINNNCLCWFGVIGREKQRIGTLRKIAEFRDSYTYYIDEDMGFSVCFPCRRDEVTFYEDREDEI